MAVLRQDQAGGLAVSKVQLVHAPGLHTPPGFLSPIGLQLLPRVQAVQQLFRVLRRDVPNPLVLGTWRNIGGQLWRATNRHRVQLIVEGWFPQAEVLVLGVAVRQQAWLV